MNQTRRLDEQDKWSVGGELALGGDDLFQRSSKVDGGRNASTLSPSRELES